jgi:hypothetical protein
MNPQHSANRTNRNIKRILITIGVTAGFLAVTANEASAGLYINHSEPTLRRP